MNFSVRHGLTRTVILTGQYAIKIPRLWSRDGGLAGALWSLARGVLANQGEADWWAWVHDGDGLDGDKFCPVLASHLGGLINIYPRCEAYEVGPEIQMAMFEGTFRPLDIAPQPSDCKADNYGWLTQDGRRRLVVIDYDMTFNGCRHDVSGARNRLFQDAHDALYGDDSGHGSGHGSDDE